MDLDLDVAGTIGGMVDLVAVGTTGDMDFTTHGTWALAGITGDGTIGDGMADGPSTILIWEVISTDLLIITVKTFLITTAGEIVISMETPI